MLTVFTQRNFVADFLQAKCDFRRKSAVLRFEPPLEGFGATYDDRLRLIGKRVVDFLLVLIELFSLGVSAEALRANIGWKSAISLQRGSVGPKFQVEGVALTYHSFSQKTTYGIKIWTDRSSVLSQSTRLIDGQTDRQTAFSSLDRVCTACSAVKTKTTGEQNVAIKWYENAWNPDRITWLSIWNMCLYFAKNTQLRNEQNTKRIHKPIVRESNTIPALTYTYIEQ